MQGSVDCTRIFVLATTLAACTAVVEGVGAPNHGEAGSGNAGASSGHGGSTGVGASVGTGGSDAPDAAGGAGKGGGAGASVDASGTGDSPDAGASDAKSGDSKMTDAPFVDAGPVGDGGFVGPVVPPDCPGDPTQGWTEYADTFHIEHPYDLMASDRYTFENGIYTFWIFPTDKPHVQGNTTAPRTETHWTNFTTGQKMWTGDVLVEAPSQNTTIFQVHTTASGAGPVYLHVKSGNVEEINGSVIARNIYDKWFNLKVAFVAATSTATIYVNDCQKLVLPNSRPGSRDFYFKNGVYTCDSSICRDHFKNIHLYQR
jgi:hypothetical protein